MNGKTKLIILIALMIIFTAGSIQAAQESLGIFKQHDCITLLQLCSSCTYNNITSIKQGNGSLLTGSAILRNGNMTNRGSEFNLTFCQSNSTGVYTVNGHGNVDGVDEVWVYDFLVTENGREEPEGIVIVVFGFVFFFLVGWWAWELRKNFAAMAEKEFLFKQVLMSNMVFLGIILYRYFCEFFFPKELVMEILLRFMEISAFTHVFLPIIGFFITLLNYYRRMKIYGEDD